MGAGASLYSAELSKPTDASDITELSAAQAEVQRLQTVFEKHLPEAEAIDIATVVDLDDGKKAVTKLRTKLHEELEQNSAATKLQGVKRQKDAVAEVGAKREEKKELDGAATKLQGIKRQKDAKAEVQSKRDLKAAAEEFPGGAEMDGAATKLQGVKRAKDAKAEVEAKREEKKEMDGAATKLQNIKRGKDAKEKVEAQKGVNSIGSRIALEVPDDVQADLHSAAFGEMCAAEFAKADTAGSGKLTGDSLVSAMQAIKDQVTSAGAAVTAENAAKALADFDADGSGAIEQGEFAHLAEILVLACVIDAPPTEVAAYCKAARASGGGEGGKYPAKPPAVLGPLTKGGQPPLAPLAA